MNRILTIAVALAFGCATPETPDSRIDCALDFTDHPATEALQAVADHGVAAGLPGLVLGVLTDDGPAVVAAGYADLEDEVPMNACHVHPLASVGKTWTATMILRGVEEGTLELDVPVTTYLADEVVRGLPQIDRITLHDLLNHGSGLRDFNEDLAYVGAEFDRSPDTIDPMHGLDAVRGTRAKFAPGDGYAYSDTAYQLLALVLDAVTGDRIDATRRAIHDPLGMAHTTLPRLDEPDPPGRVNAYWEVGGGRLENISELQSKYDRQVIGAGNVRATPSDALTFLSELVHGDVLSAESLAAMQTINPHSEDDDGDGYGYGLARTTIADRVFWGHTGGDVGAGSFLEASDDGLLTIVGLTNAGMFLGGPLQDVWNESLVEDVVAAATP